MKQRIKFTKRIGHLYELVCDLDNIKKAILRASKGKRNRPSVARILADVDGYARKIQEMLLTETWVPHPYHMKKINDGIKKKVRLIAIPRFYPDQCVHHAFIQVFKEIVMHSACDHSCGCVPGKGVRGAKDAIEKWITHDPKGTSKLIKLDIKQCYPTIPHAGLMDKMRSKIKDRKFLRLAQLIIASYQQAMVTKTRMLPETEAVGIPVGIYTSPWFCNFYFSELDHKIQETTGVKHSVRYADDMVLFDSSKKRLWKAFALIRKEVGKLGMKVKENWQLFRLSKRPLDFLGYKFHKDGTVTIRKSIMLRISRKAARISKLEYISPTNASGMVSYMGYIKASDSRGFYETWIKPKVNIKFLKGVISNENRKHNQACCPV